jgi:tetratricopeptide (TPR) repeat protein
MRPAALPPASSGNARRRRGGPLSPSPPFPPPPLHPFPLRSCERYGQLAPVVAPIYYSYGDVLLHNVEVSSDALGGPAPEEEGAGSSSSSSSSSAAAAPAQKRTGSGVSESKGDDDDDDDDEEEDEEEEDGAGAGAGASSSSSAAAAGGPSSSSGAAGDEDITNADADADGGDLEIAWECLDVARVIYSRMEGRESQLALARAQLRLGDCHMESDRFDMALEEYKACLEIRSRLLPKFDRNLADVLIQMMIARIQLSCADAAISEPERRVHLSQAALFCKAATEVLVDAANEVAGRLGNAEFQRALKAELEAGALERQYPPGITTTCIGLFPVQLGGGAGAGAAASSAALGEPDIRVFRTLYEKFGTIVSPTHTNPAVVAEKKAEDATTTAVLGEGAAAPAAAPSKPARLDDLCDYIDMLVQRVSLSGGGHGARPARRERCPVGRGVPGRPTGPPHPHPFPPLPPSPPFSPNAAQRHPGGPRCVRRRHHGAGLGQHGLQRRRRRRHDHRLRLGRGRQRRRGRRGRRLLVLISVRLHAG